MKNAFILRGLPGSGKSTLAQSLAIDAAICSTDKFFIDPYGEYKFDRSMLGVNHDRNRKYFETLCVAGAPNIVCDNTNMTHKEYQPYEDLAIANCYRVFVITVGNPKDEFEQELCAFRNKHGVPLEVIQRMGARFQF